MGASEHDRLAHGVFFIIGAPRSGTTLLQSVLASHPRITIPPETEFFMKFVPPRDPDGWEAWWRRYLASSAWTDQSLDAQELRRRVEATDGSARAVFLELLAMHAERSGKPRVGEKSPQHARCIDRILEALPEARFIHIHRDPRDVVASRLRVPWTRASHLGLARSWVKDVGASLARRDALGPERFVTVAYESLARDVEPEARRLCAFLGEEFDGAMTRFHERADTGFADRERQWKDATRRPANTASVGRFERDLTPRQIAGVERIATPLMERLGYEHHTTTRKPAWILLDALDRTRDRLRKLRRSLGKRLGARDPAA